MVSDKLDILVLAGQSNAQGQGQGETEKEYVPNERVLMMTDDADPRFVTENGTVRLVMKQPAIKRLATETIFTSAETFCASWGNGILRSMLCLQSGKKTIVEIGENIS